MPALSYPLPPWIGQSADPAAHYQSGFQIGMHLGAQQAAQIFQQQQAAREERKMLMAQQQQEVENQMQEQVLNLKAAEMARAHQASQVYQARIAAGEDPSAVLMSMAPDLGESPVALMRQQETRDQARALQQYRMANLNRMTQADAMRAIPKPTSQERERADLTDLQRQSSNLEAQLKADPNNAPLKAKLQDVLNQIQTWNTQHPGGMSTSVTLDKEGNLQLQMQPGKIQPGAAAEIQKELAADHASITQIMRARKSLRPQDVGIAGKVWDEVMNKWMEQVIPGSGDPSVSANRVMLQKSADAYLQNQTRLGRLSAEEREGIRSALATRNSGESYARSAAVLDAMARIQQFDSIAKAKQAKQALEPWMFEGLSIDEIKQLLKEQTLTTSEAMDWAKKAPYRTRPMQ